MHFDAVVKYFPLEHSGNQTKPEITNQYQTNQWTDDDRIIPEHIPRFLDGRERVRVWLMGRTRTWALPDRLVIRWRRTVWNIPMSDPQNQVLWQVLDISRIYPPMMEYSRWSNRFLPRHDCWPTTLEYFPIGHSGTFESTWDQGMRAS